MSDLISRADAIEAIASRDETDGTVKVFTGREVNEILSALSSADAVEMVRCKDCVYSEAMITTGLVYCNEIKTACSEEGYCYIGERRGW